MKRGFAWFIREGVYAALACLVSFMALLVLMLAAINSPLFSPLDLVKLVLLLLLLFFPAALVSGLAAGIITAAFSRIPSIGTKAGRIPWSLFLAYYLGQIVVAILYNSFIFKKLALNQGYLVSALFFVIILGGLAMLLTPLFERLRRLSLAAAAVFILLIFVFMPLSLVHREDAGSQPAPPSNLLKPAGYKLVLIGVDGMSWRFADQLLAEGKLPNLDYLLKKGARANHPSLRPTRSPHLWTTIATGKSYQQHQITDFITYRIPFTNMQTVSFIAPRRMWVFTAYKIVFEDLFHNKRRVINGSFRRQKAVWNILSDQGVKSGVIDWLMSWPAENINGLVVADKVIHYKESAVRDIERPTAGLTSPPELIQEVEPLLFPPEQISDETIRRYMKIGDDEIAQLRNGGYKTRQKGSGLFFGFSMVESLDRICRQLMKEHPEISFWAVYTRNVERADHAAMRYSFREKNPKYSEEEIRKYGMMVDEAYKDADRLIGDIVNTAGTDSIFIVISDHGFGKQWDGKYNHEYAPPGLFLISGGPVQPGAALNHPTVFDVVPTILYLLGLPVAQDLPGRVLTEALNPEFMRQNPERKIPTYGSYTPMKEPQSDKAIDKEIMRELRSMGYLK